MDKKVKKYLKLAVTLVVIGLFVWFLILYPLISFGHYEKEMEKAAERYFVTKPGELPTGERIKTLTLQDLFYEAYLKEDFYIPYTKDPCSLKDSWVKVRKENGEYKYYTYLKCGALTSKIDHKGPKITLEGSSEMRIAKGEEFKDPGVKSVVDNNDGKMEIKDVVVKGEVDSNKIGTYELTYTAYDKLNNKTEVKRKVEVVQVLKTTVKETLKNEKLFKGEPTNNYIYFSSMVFRIIGLDGENVRIVSDEDIANVNYDGIESWLDDYFYKHLNENSKKLIVENKYCNLSGTGENLKATTCSSYTGKKKVYIPSIVDINNAMLQEQDFMKPSTMSWTSAIKDKDNAYLTRNYFVGEESGSDYMSFDKKYNFGVRPVITIKGDTLIKSGDGTEENPYNLGDVTKAKPETLVSERNSGEYLLVNNILFRIIESDNDGTTKVIADDSLIVNGMYAETFYDNDTGIYNPTKKGNVGYYINNRSSEYIDSSYFVNKNVVVPIYNNESNYGKEVDTKKYKVKFFAPNMYDMFSVKSNDSSGSYWLINSSKNENIKNAVSSVNVVMYGELPSSMAFGVRVVGYLNSKCSIVSGNGTKNSPYKIDK